MTSLLLGALALLGGPAATSVLAQGGTSFVARTDRTSTTLGDTFTYEVTLSIVDGQMQSYRRPDFRGFRVEGEYPSQSTQIQMGGGASVMRAVHVWRYELSPAQSGRLTIGPARVRVGARELRTASININVSSGALAPPGRSADAAEAQAGRGSKRPAPARSQRRFRHPFDDLFGIDDPIPEPPVTTAADPSFIRSVADKPKLYVGEQVVVQWFLYLTDRADKYQALTEPRTDGFWSEDLAMPNSQGGLSLSQETYQGRLFLVAPLLRKALFPLQPGKLTVTPLESEISQVDFFGRQARTQRLKADPLHLDVLPLPSAGKPAGFDPAAVGRFTLEAKLDRARVTLGEPVTVKVTVSGAGNLRKLAPPALPSLDGWRTYDPKTDLRIENTDGISGVKTVEYLLMPQRTGVTTVPAFVLPYFDPAEGKYLVARSAGLRVEVVGDATGPGVAGAGPGAPAVAGIENVLPSEIRPLRSTPQLTRDLGTTFYRSSGFLFAVLLPPLALGLTAVLDGLRSRRGRDTERGRRRKTRALVKQHLRAAEAELARGNTGGFFAEIDRVLRGVLNARLGRAVAGLSRAELAAELTASGLSAALSERLVGELESCDRARFAPGAVGAEQMRAGLERAEELILQVEKSASIGGANARPQRPDRPGPGAPG